MATTPAAMTGSEYDALPYEEGRRWELLDGELIPVSSPIPWHQDIVACIFAALRHYNQLTGAGRVYQDVEFALSADHRVRPDIAVLLAEKAARLDRMRIPIPGAPDIAVEVVSPSERKRESEAKVQAYLRCGTTEVWHVYPESRTLDIYRDDSRRNVSAGEIVSDLLPGFSLTLSTIFE